MMVTTLVYGSITVAKYLIVGNLLISANRLMLTKSSVNEIEVHKKWSDMR